jgi:NhaA family Na+:H+ antiporter
MKNSHFKQFFESEKAGGLVLLFFTILSLLFANSSFQDQYLNFWNTVSIGGMTLNLWINDGLMAIFFLLIGLELKREILVGELSSLKSASLPVFSALGGMLVPALIYLYFNWGLTSSNGFGIPTATDIAFAIGILSLLGNKVPLSLKVFLTALAVIDDLGAILVIAFFYTKTIFWSNLLISLAIFLMLLLLNRAKVTTLWIYLFGGVFMWYFMHHSGVHATITGVLLAFCIPTFQGKRKAPALVLQKALHYPVPFVIIPLFALANTAIPIDENWDQLLVEPVSLGVIFGLLIGKPVGIMLFTKLSIWLKIAQKPKGVSWGQLIGVSILAGIGFTMSIFITLLAFDSEKLINEAKIAILIGSLITAILGLLWLQMSLNKKKTTRKSATS